MMVSPSRIFACAKPTHENSAAVAGSNGLKHAGGRRVGEGNRSASPRGRPGKDNATSADLTEKVSAGRPERPAIPDLIPSRPGWQERAHRSWAEYDNQQKATQ